MLLNYKSKFFLFTSLLILLSFSAYAKKAPESFANLAEMLSPSVVNISTTTVIEDRKQNLPAFPPGSPFEEFFKQYHNQPHKLRIIDVFMVFAFLTGVIQFIYVCIVGTFPFNSFLSGFISTVGTFVLLGLQTTSSFPFFNF